MSVGDDTPRENRREFCRVEVFIPFACRLVPPEEGARHWYETVFVPILALIDSTGVGKLLESMTDADRFLLFRRGIDVPMLPGWRIPPAAAERGMENITDRAQVTRSKRLASLARRPKTRNAPLLPEETLADDEGSTVP